MSTATKARIYDAAEAHDVRVRKLESPTNGRSWNYELHDLRHPERTVEKCYRDTTDYAISTIERFAGPSRERWERMLEANAQQAAEQAAKDEADRLAAEHAEANSLDKLIAADLPETPAAPAIDFPEILEVPGDEEAAYADGYNAGLTEGLALAAEGAPTITHTSVTMTDEDAYDAGYRQAELDLAEATDHTVEQARRQFMLDQADTLERERLEAFAAGKEEGANGLEDAIQGRTRQLVAENAALKLVIQDIRDGAMRSAAYIDATHQATVALAADFHQRLQRLSTVGTDALRDKELEWQAHVDHTLARQLAAVAAQQEQEAA